MILFDLLFVVFSLVLCGVFFFKQKTAYEMRISDWSSDVCSSDLASLRIFLTPAMTLIDVDGSLPPAQLGPKGAALAAKAIRRMGITGSIGIDLPTMNNKDRKSTRLNSSH